MDLIFLILYYCNVVYSIISIIIIKHRTDKEKIHDEYILLLYILLCCIIIFFFYDKIFNTTQSTTTKINIISSIKPYYIVDLLLKK